MPLCHGTWQKLNHGIQHKKMQRETQSQKISRKIPIIVARARWRGHNGDKVVERDRATKTELRWRRGKTAKTELSQRRRERNENKVRVLIFLNLSLTSDFFILKIDVNQGK